MSHLMVLEVANDATVIHILVRSQAICMFGPHVCSEVYTCSKYHVGSVFFIMFVVYRIGFSLL